uniref:MnmG N-terminal domain-containing protein n=1 Tax=Spumella elongata TaxID=89044 RepID=A0A7S3HDY2_9STRA
MQALILSYPNLKVVEASAEDLILEEGSSGSAVVGIKTNDGREIHTGRVVITTGTFLRGRCFLGRTSYPAGRHMRTKNGESATNKEHESGGEIEPPSIGLALTLERFNTCSES